MPCQQGRWQLVVGSTNAILATITLVNLIKPGALSLARDALTRPGAVHLIDIVWSEGGDQVRLHWLRISPTQHSPWCSIASVR